MISDMTTQPLDDFGVMPVRQQPGLQRNAATQLREPDRVLVVDDEPPIAELLAMALRYDGWDVHVAHDGLSAVRQARDVRPDVVVLDMMLPGRSGFLVLEKIKSKKPRGTSLQSIS